MAQGGSNGQRVVFDTTAPGASNFGDTAAAGSAATPARLDHRHSREANPVTGHNVATNVHGLPANVSVLGDRTSNGRFVQTAIGTTTYGAGSSFTLNNLHISGTFSFGVAFSSTPVIVIGGGDPSNGAPGAVVAPTTTGFKVWAWDNQANSFSGAVHYIALGF